MCRIREAEDEERAKVQASNERHLAELERERQQRKNTPLLANPQGRSAYPGITWALGMWKVAGNHPVNPVKLFTIQRE